MIIYYSMILWVGLMSLLTAGIERDRYFKKVPMIMAVLTFAYLIFWIGMRQSYIDTAAYIRTFRAVDASLSQIPDLWMEESKSPGFDTLQVLFKHFISTDPQAWLMAIAVVSGVPVMLTFRKHSENFFFSVFLFLATTSFTWMMNGIRQFLVVAILFGCSDWIEENKWLRFTMLVLLLSTIHYTALIMIPVFWIVRGRPWGKRIFLFIGVILLCSLFVDSFIQVIENVLENTPYSGITDQFASDDGVNPLRVAVHCVPVAVAFFGRKRLEELDNPYVNLCVNMSIISAGLYFIGMFTSGILVGRLPIYCSLYNLMLLPYLFNHCFSPRDRKYMYLFCALGYVAYFFVIFRGNVYVSRITGVIY